MQKIISYIKKEVVLTVALVLAVVSGFFVRPDGEYLGYIDYQTLALLFCLMVVMAGLQEMGVFYRVGVRLLGRVHSARQVAGILIFLCFFSSMVITNDVALITFVPFAVTVLRMASMEEQLIPVVVLQTVAANLGSMATPIGNPQNLYLYSRSGIRPEAFFRLTAPFTILAFFLFLGFLLVMKDRKIEVSFPEDSAGTVGRCTKLWMYLALFLVSVSAVARLFPWQAAFFLVVLTVFLAERGIFLRVDYTLLFTFAGFFVFIGNLGRIEEFRALLAGTLAGNELLTSVAASQVISNVPAALLLSGFSREWEALILGTNLGGLGTLIASMASLISYKYIAREYSGHRGRYLVYFTAVNLIFLAVLAGAAKIRIFCG